MSQVTSFKLEIIFKLQNRLSSRVPYVQKKAFVCKFVKKATDPNILFLGYLGISKPLDDTLGVASESSNGGFKMADIAFYINVRRTVTMNDRNL